MRTKSKAVHRNNSDQPLEDYCSVSADASVGSPSIGADFRGCPNSDTLVGVSIHVDTFLDSNNGHGVGAMDMLDPGVKDVDDSFDYTNVLCEGSVAATNVAAVSTRLSNGITINEPNTAAVMGGGGVMS